MNLEHHNIHIEKYTPISVNMAYVVRLDKKCAIETVNFSEIVQDQNTFRTCGHVIVLIEEKDIDNIDWTNPRTYFYYGKVKSFGEIKKRYIGYRTCDMFLTNMVEFDVMEWYWTKERIIDLCYKTTIIDENIFKSQEVCNYVYSIFTDMIKVFPSKFQTEVMCCDYVSKNGLNLKHIKKTRLNKNTDKIRNISYCATINNGLAIKYVNKHVRNVDIVMISLMNNGLALKYIGEYLKEIDDVSIKLCQLALYNNEKAIKYVPNILMIDDVCLIAIDKDPTMLKYINRSKQTVEMVREALLKDITTFKYVAERLQTNEICKYVLSIDDTLKKHISMKKRIELGDLFIKN